MYVTNIKMTSVTKTHVCSSLSRFILPVKRFILKHVGMCHCQVNPIHLQSKSKPRWRWWSPSHAMLLYPQDCQIVALLFHFVLFADFHCFFFVGFSCCQSLQRIGLIYITLVAGVAH
jgi:hypothetical protein